MKKGKRLLVVLLATLVLMVSAVSITYATDYYDETHTSSHNATVTATDGKLVINCNYYRTSGSDYHYCQYYNDPTVTITPATNLVYNGEQKPVAISGIVEGIEKVSLYYSGTEADGSEYALTSAAPINAGTYTASLTLNVRGEGQFIITKKFTIAPRPVSVVWSDGDTEEGLSYPYDAASHLPTAAFETGAILTDDTVTLNVDASQAQTEVGTNYPVVATVSGAQKDNYTVSGLETKFNITAVQAIIEEIKWSPNPATHVYDGKNWAPTAVGKIKDSDPAKWIALEVKVQDPNTESAYLTNYKDAGKYTAEVVGSADPDYSTVSFSPETLIKTKEYTITPCPISIEWAYASQYVYNGQPQEPTATVEGTVGGETVTPKVTIDETNKTTKMTVAGEGYAVNDIKSIHAGNFTARVQKTVLDNDGLVSENPGLPNVTNYKLVNDSVSELYTIDQKLVDIDWYRPDVDKYGDLKSGDDPVVKIEDNSTPLNLVYNGEQQAPTARLKDKELVTNSVALGGAPTADICNVSVQGPTAAVNVGRYDVQKIGLSNNDYDALEKGRSYNIVPRPVKLKWEHYHDIYNGEAQGTTVTITNPQYKDTVTAKTTYPETDTDDTSIVRKHFGSNGDDGDEAVPTTALSDTRRREPVSAGEIASAAGSDIEDGRTPIDAGLYTIIPGPLDNENYTYQTLLIEKAADEVLNKNDFVDLYKTYYMIHQFVIADIDWSNTTTTYNASYQLPTAKVNADSLKGGDTNEQVELMLADAADREVDDFLGFVNAETYTVFVPHDPLRGIKGERSMNYLIAESVTQHLSSAFTINKRPLAVIANPKTIWYRDEPSNAGVTYRGLINGIPNGTDDLGGGIPGSFINNDNVEEDVVKGTPVYTYSYAKNGKPGTYKIFVSGLESTNYDIQPVAGDLTVLDRVTALNAKGTKKGSKGILVSWNGVTGAASYDVYASLCNTKKKTYMPVYVGSTTANKFKVTKIGKKKLKTRTPYKYYVVAKDAAGNPITRSVLGHFITNNVKGKQVNAKSMSVNTHVVSIGKGGTAGLSASYKKAKKGKKYKLLDGIHDPLSRFVSENPEVAVVDANGVVTGVGSGWCRVYVVGVSGMWETVEVYVQ